MYHKLSTKRSAVSGTRKPAMLNPGWAFRRSVESYAVVATGDYTRGHGGSSLAFPCVEVVGRSVLGTFG